MLRTKTIRTYVSLVACLAAGGLLMATPADAATDTANMAVSATVTANCTISSGGLAFGSYDPVETNASTPLDQTGTVTVTCTSGCAGDITLSQGANADTGSTNDAPLRRMTDGTHFLSYGLFQNAGRTTVWGTRQRPT